MGVGAWGVGWVCEGQTCGFAFSLIFSVLKVMVVTLWKFVSVCVCVLVCVCACMCVCVCARARARARRALRAYVFFFAVCRSVSMCEQLSLTSMR